MMQAAATLLDAAEFEVVLINLEIAADIEKRADFFGWVQGAFQAVLPHEALVCGLSYPSARLLTFEWLGSYPLSDESFAALCGAQRGLCYGLLELWERSGRVPLALGVEPEPDALPETSELLREMEQLDLGNAVAHGVPGIEGRPAAFFQFFKLRGRPGSRELRILRFFLPYLYTAWLRAIAAEAMQSGASRPMIRGILTAREMEVLQLLEQGKTNKQIAVSLGRRENTVDTHMERIFRKLDVHTRAEAVAKSLELNLARGRGPGWRYHG